MTNIHQFSQLKDIGELPTHISLKSSTTNSNSNSTQPITNETTSNKQGTLLKYQENVNEEEDLEFIDDLSFSKFSNFSGKSSSVIFNNNKTRLINSSNSHSNSPFVKKIKQDLNLNFGEDRKIPTQSHFVFPITEENSKEGSSLLEERNKQFDQEILKAEKLREKHANQLNKVNSTPKHQRTSSVKVSLTPAQKFEKRPNTHSSNALNDFKFHNLVGNGAFASVYKATNLKTNQIIAIKQIRLEQDQDVAVLMGEIDLLKILKHPNIVKYHGFVKTSDSLNILLEYCAGGSLRQLYKKNNSGLAEMQIVNYTKQVIQGLAYLHDQGVVHRDVKAANVLLTENGDVKLADFGVATKVNNSHFTLVGTPNWMAPETILGGDGLCTASDIWSLGATIIELFTTYPPYHDLNAMATLHAIGTDEHPPLPKNISSLAREFLLECFQKQPNLRISARLLLKHNWLNQDINRTKSSHPLNKPRPSMDLKSIKTYTENNEDNWDHDFSEIKIPKNLESTRIHSLEIEDENSSIIPTKFSKHELLNKFAESESEDLDSVEMGNTNYGSLKINNMVVNDVDESDPFSNIQMENFDTNEIEIQNKMEYMVTRLARKLEQAHQGNEDAIASMVKITGRMLHLIKKYPISHDTFIRDHGVLSLLELLESFQDFSKQQQLWYHSLSILNYIFENSIDQLESFCFLGGIPTVAQFRSGSYDVQVRLQVARFIKCLNCSDKALSMFVSCGGLRLVSKFVEEDFDSTPMFPLVAIDCIHNVLKNDLSRSKSDLCRILSKHGVIFWFVVLLNRLVKFDRNRTDIRNTIEKIMDIIKYFSQSETRVRITIASADLFKLCMKLHGKLETAAHQLIMLKFLKSMSCISDVLKYLYRAEIVEFLVHVLEKFTPSTTGYKEVINVTGPILYNCLSLNHIKESEFISLGGLPYLKALSMINLPFRQFVLPILCEFVHCEGQTRNELKKNEILNVYFNLLLDPYWQSNALDSIYHWYQKDSKYVKLDSPMAADCLIGGFLLPKVSSLESTLEIYLQLITVNTNLTRIMSDLNIMNNILMKLAIYKKNPVIELQLMKILRFLIIFSLNEDNSDLKRISRAIINTLESLNSRSTSVLVDEVATEILTILS
ncbi:unnamed protein product [Candida verbasci]|uniref:Protein kinase domain-containing protein n=1 Tax=Candida verbasci TaxID=1227364 RepID=A0A9W4TTB9_9ASCO|nr:unnamed protein product [Candida verbasci]